MLIILKIMLEKTKSHTIIRITKIKNMKNLTTKINLLSTALLKKEQTQKMIHNSFKLKFLQDYLIYNRTMLTTKEECQLQENN